MTLERLKRCHRQSKANWTRGEPFGVGGLGGQHCHTLLGRGWPGRGVGSTFLGKLLKPLGFGNTRMSSPIQKQ